MRNFLETEESAHTCYGMHFLEHSAAQGDKEGYKEHYQFPAILDALW